MPGVRQMLKNAQHAESAQAAYQGYGEKKIRHTETDLVSQSYALGNNGFT